MVSLDLWVCKAVTQASPELVRFVMRPLSAPSWKVQGDVSAAHHRCQHGTKTVKCLLDLFLKFPLPCDNNTCQ